MASTWIYCLGCPFMCQHVYFFNENPVSHKICQIAIRRPVCLHIACDVCCVSFVAERGWHTCFIDSPLAAKVTGETAKKVAKRHQCRPCQCEAHYMVNNVSLFWWNIRPIFSNLHRFTSIYVSWPGHLHQFTSIYVNWPCHLHRFTSIYINLHLFMHRDSQDDFPNM